jgi:DNA-binding GntR family transcriptional regulator
MTIHQTDKAMQLAKLEVRTLSDRLVDVLRDMIISGAVPPNVPIRQDALAAELRVSKIPLREALARLEQDGLVFSHANRGFFVRPMSGEEAEEIYALRLKIEPDAAAAACLKATETDQDTARRALNLLDIDAAAHRPTVGALNRAFHLALVQPGGQAITTNLVARLHILADRYVRKHLEPKGRNIRAEAEHEEILKFWLRRQDEKVRTLVGRHLELTLADLRRQLRAEAVAEAAPKPRSRAKHSKLPAARQRGRAGEGAAPEKHRKR